MIFLTSWTTRYHQVVTSYIVRCFSKLGFPKVFNTFMFTSRAILHVSRLHKTPIPFRTMATKSTPGENFEVRQTSATEDWHPDPSKSPPISPARQALIDDIIALYSCEPTIERVKRYTPDCV